MKDASLAVVLSAYDQAINAATTAGSGESSRAQAAEALRQQLNTARPLLEQAIVQLKARYYANLAQLEDWGLDTVASSRGVTVRKPRLQNDWFHFLHAYVTKEASLPADDRLTIPAFAQMQALDASVQTTLAARSSARTQRKINVYERSAAAQRLFDLLQTACVIRVALTYNSVVTNDLQRWGFVVESRTPYPTRENGAMPSSIPAP